MIYVPTVKICSQEILRALIQEACLPLISKLLWLERVLMKNMLVE